MNTLQMEPEIRGILDIDKINADDVKCSHRSTSARVSKGDTFYLMAHGIQPKLPRSLVTKCFSAKAIEKTQG